MKISDILHRLVTIKEIMWKKLIEVDIVVDFDGYEKIHDMYLDRFGNDSTIREYEEINQSLSDCPIMTD